MLRDYNLYSPGTAVYYNGKILQIATIDKQDINVPVNLPADDADPDLFNNLDADGAAQGMVTESMHGRRMGEIVKITGFTVSVKAFFAALQPLSQFSEAVGGGHQAAQPPNVPRQLETVVLKWALVGVRDDQAVMGNLGDIPDIEALLPFPAWGYSKHLDLDEARFRQTIKLRTFVTGEFSVNIQNTRHKDKTATEFVRLPKPLEVKYAVNDQNGRVTRTWRFFLVLRSNVPHGPDGTQTHNYSAYAPLISAMTKTHYFE